MAVKKYRITLVAAMLGMCVMNSDAIAATFTPLDLSNIANLPLQNKNAAYPQGDFLTRYAVPFTVSTSFLNAWGSGDGIGGGGGNNGLWTETLNVGVDNVKTIYTLADTDWGRRGNQRFSVTATFDNGKSLIWKYTDGEQLRDWNSFFASSINGTNTNEVFRVSPPLPVFDGNPDVLDMQTLSVPSEFYSSTLETLVFTDDRQTFVHSAFVAGVTLSDIGPLTPALMAGVVPEAETWMMITAGLLLIGWQVRRQKQA